jgi:hypothetical protein
MCVHSYIQLNGLIPLKNKINTQKRREEREWRRGREEKRKRGEEEERGRGRGERKREREESRRRVGGERRE